MSNGLAVFATSPRRGHFLRPSIVLIMYFRRKCEGIFVVVPLNLQLYVLISPIWPADAEIKALETKRLKNWTNNCHERYCSSWIMCIKGFVYHLSRLGLLTETLTGTLLELKRLFTQDLTLSTGTVELRFLKRGCLQSDKIAANRYHNRPLREQFPPLIMPTMPWIETHQPWARFVIHQSLTIMVV